jgi:hypothetical protein
MTTAAAIATARRTVQTRRADFLAFPGLVFPGLACSGLAFCGLA